MSCESTFLLSLIVFVFVAQQAFLYYYMVILYDWRALAWLAYDAPSMCALFTLDNAVTSSGRVFNSLPLPTYSTAGKLVMLYLRAPQLSPLDIFGPNVLKYCARVLAIVLAAMVWREQRRIGARWQINEIWVSLPTVLFVDVIDALSLFEGFTDSTLMTAAEFNTGIALCFVWLVASSTTGWIMFAHYELAVTEDKLMSALGTELSVDVLASRAALGSVTPATFSFLLNLAVAGYRLALVFQNRPTTVFLVKNVVAAVVAAHVMWEHRKLLGGATLVECWMMFYMGLGMKKKEQPAGAADLEANKPPPAPTPTPTPSPAPQARIRDHSDLYRYDDDDYSSSYSGDGSCPPYSGRSDPRVLAGPEIASPSQQLGRLRHQREERERRQQQH